MSTTRTAFRPDRSSALACLLLLIAAIEPAAAEDWLTRLHSADATERLAASFDVDPAPPTAAALREALSAALADPDPYVRRAGVAALGELEVDPDWAAARLAEAASDADELVAAHALVACGKVGRSVVKPLLASLREAVKEERREDEEPFRAARQIAASLLAVPELFEEVLPALEDELGAWRLARSESGAADADDEAFLSFWAFIEDPTRSSQEVYLGLLLAVADARHVKGEPCRRLREVLGPESGFGVDCQPSVSAPRVRETLADREAKARQVEEGLGSDDLEVRKKAVRNAEKVLDLLSIEGLLKVLGSDSVMTVAAAGELARRGVATEATAEALARVLSTRTWGGELLDALAVVAELDRDAVLSLRHEVLALAGNERLDGGVRAAALRLLPELFGATREALEVTAAALLGEEALQAEAVRAFAGSEPSYPIAVEVLTPLLDEDGYVARPAAFLITEAAGREPDPPDLTWLLNHPSPEVRAAVLGSARPGLLSPQAEQGGLLYLRMEDPSIAVRAGIALAPRRPELLARLLADVPLGLRPFRPQDYRALGSLAAGAPPELRGRIEAELNLLLRVALDEEDGWRRRRSLAAVQILAPRLGEGEAAAKLLRPLLWVEERWIRDAAREALLGLAEKATKPSSADFALQIDELVLDAFHARLRDVRQSFREAAVDRGPFVVGLPDLRPWPPPPFSRWDVLPPNLYREEGVTYADVLDWLRGALEGAGFSGSGLFGVPEGFALVSPLERIDESGVSLSGEARWIRGKLPLEGFDIGEYLRRLFLAPPGNFRLVVFVVTRERDLSGGEGSFDPELASSGLPSRLGLPDSLARRPIGEAWVHVLVYHFRKKLGRQDLLRPSTLTFERHLEGSGLAPFLTSFR